jgi:hypothetical protein
MEDTILRRERSIGWLEISIGVDLKEERWAREEQQEHRLGENWRKRGREMIKGGVKEGEPGSREL